MSDYTDANREMGFESHAQAAKLVLRSLSGEESLGRLGEFHVEALSKERALKATDFLGTPISVRLEVSESGPKRFFNGFVTEFSQSGTYAGLHRYRMTLRPWLWFLTRATNCRIFQEKSVPDIVKAVFSDHGFTDFRDDLSGTHAVREYCVQYGETDFNFVSRLMESEGIYYFFEHTDRKHTLVLADASSAHADLPGGGALDYRPDNEGAASDDTVTYWEVTHRVVSGAYAVKAYDFEKPRADLAATSAGTGSYPHADMELYDYADNYKVRADGEALTRQWLEAHEAQHEVAQSATRFRPLAVGTTMTLTGHPTDALNKKYLITHAHFELDASDAITGGKGGGEPFHAAFSVIPAVKPYRAPITTPRPRIRGPQTAMVVGKSGEEIWTDKYGRVKVQFPWDRDGQSNETSSCWVRVAQVWAGKNWGAVFTPRIGHEVVVAFLEGDPDRPLVIGSVYNGTALPPYDLPANQTRSVIKTRSTKGAGTDNFNEIRFEDKKDSEEIYVHAEKDMNRVVENNDTLKVGFEKKDKGDQTIEIHNDRKLTVGHDQISTVKNDRKMDVGNNETVTVKNNQNVTINNACTIEAKASMELKVGASSIKLEPGKITIKTPQLAIQADGTAEMKSNGPMTVKSSAVLIIEGSLVKIN